MDKVGFAVVVEPACGADSVCLVRESVSAAEKSEPASWSVPASELLNVAHSSAEEAASWAYVEAAVKSLADSDFAVAVMSVGEPRSASGQPEP